MNQSRVHIETDMATSAIEKLDQVTAQMKEAGLCNEFAAILGISVGSLVRIIGADKTDLMLAEMVAAIATSQSSRVGISSTGPRR